MKHFLSIGFVFVVLMIFSVMVSVADLSEGLVAYWPMDEGSGGIAHDATGNGNDGALLGGAAWETANTASGAACIDFNGTDALVEMEPFDVLGGGITMAAWVNAASFNISDGRIISKAVEWGSDDHFWMLSTVNDDHAVRFRLRTDDGQPVPTLVATSGQLAVGVWAHLAAVWDGTDMKLYANGQEVGSAAKGGSAVATDPSVKVSIGSQPTEAFATDPTHVEKYFHGLIDEVAIYNRGLSANEVGELMSGPPATAVSAADKLATTWAQVKKR